MKTTKQKRIKESATGNSKEKNSVESDEKCALCKRLGRGWQLRTLTEGAACSMQSRYGQPIACQDCFRELTVGDEYPIRHGSWLDCLCQSCAKKRAKP